MFHTHGPLVQQPHFEEQLSRCRPELHALYRDTRLIVPDTMEGEQSRGSGVQPQGPLQGALGLQGGFGAPYEHGLPAFQWDRALLARF